MSKPDDFKNLAELEKESVIFELRQKLAVSEKKRTRLEQCLAIHRRWVKLRDKLSPSEYHGKIIGGVCTDVLQANFFGCITSFITRGKLSAEQLQHLLSACEELNSIQNDLQGYGGYYFNQLGLIATLIINFENEHSI